MSRRGVRTGGQADLFDFLGRRDQKRCQEFFLMFDPEPQRQGFDCFPLQLSKSWGHSKSWGQARRIAIWENRMPQDLKMTGRLGRGWAFLFLLDGQLAVV